MLDLDVNDWYDDEDCEKLIVEYRPHAEYIYGKSGGDRKQAISDTIEHVSMVSVFLDRVANALRFRGLAHDWTKFDFPNLTFEEHMNYERHHLNLPSGVHDDVDLLDVMEFVADCVSAGLQRSGEVKVEYLSVPDEVLQRAVYNTATKLVKMCALNEESFR